MVRKSVSKNKAYLLGAKHRSMVFKSVLMNESSIEHNHSNACLAWLFLLDEITSAARSETKIKRDFFGSYNLCLFICRIHPKIV